MKFIEKIPSVLPDCEVVLITATSIINETIDDILVHAGNCKYVALLGHSTPLTAVCNAFIRLKFFCC
jgi:uncharacterized protein (DUF4213/DUF364 family)